MHEVGEGTEFDDLAARVKTRDGACVAEFRALELSSVFQPVVDLWCGRIVGHEALVRLTYPNGRTISPVRFFAGALDESALTELDRLCRALHLRNFLTAPSADGWLFLNISPRVVLASARQAGFLRYLVESAGLPASRIVIEMVESSIPDEAALLALTHSCRELGCRVAIDDFGTGASSFGRVLQMAPDIVKLDRTVVAQAVHDAGQLRLLKRMTEVLHEIRALVVMEGVETEAELQLALEAGVDLGQGYHLGRPEPRPVNEAPELAPSLAAFAARSEATQVAAADAARYWGEALERAAEALGGGWNRAQQVLLALPGAVRCYLVDADGRQCEETLVPDGAVPLLDSTGCYHGGEAFFIAARATPGSLQVRPPAFSARCGRHCWTIARAVPLPDGAVVLCCDIDVASAEAQWAAGG